MNVVSVGITERKQESNEGHDLLLSGRFRTLVRTAHIYLSCCLSLVNYLIRTQGKHSPLVQVQRIRTRITYCFLVVSHMTIIQGKYNLLSTAVTFKRRGLHVSPVCQPSSSVLILLAVIFLPGFDCRKVYLAFLGPFLGDAAVASAPHGPSMPPRHCTGNRRQRGSSQERHPKPQDAATPIDTLVGRSWRDPSLPFKTPSKKGVYKQASPFISNMKGISKSQVYFYEHQLLSYVATNRYPTTLFRIILT